MTKSKALTVADTDPEMKKIRIDGERARGLAVIMPLRLS